MKKIIDVIKKFFKKYSHIWTASYFLIYMPWFMTLEKYITADSEFYLMHTRLDDFIPFCEYFVVPYLLWFVYVPLVMGFLCYKSKQEWYNACIYLFGGMTICLFVCTVFPNGQDLRIQNFDATKNIFTRLVAMIYSADTNTNVFPSIHSFNSVACFLMLARTETLRGRLKTVMCYLAGILSVSIVLSTMFLKQHSVLDAMAGVTLAVVGYVLVYNIDWETVAENNRIKAEKKKAEFKARRG